MRELVNSTVYIEDKDDAEYIWIIVAKLIIKLTKKKLGLEVFENRI